MSAIRFIVVSSVICVGCGDGDRNNGGGVVTRAVRFVTDNDVEVTVLATVVQGKDDKVMFAYPLVVVVHCDGHGIPSLAWQEREKRRYVSIDGRPISAGKDDIVLIDRGKSEHVQVLKQPTWDPQVFADSSTFTSHLRTVVEKILSEYFQADITLLVQP